MAGRACDGGRAGCRHGAAGRSHELSIRFDSGGWLQRLLGKTAGVVAVDRVSLTIRNGEVLGLVGESGCGKSTLGRLLLRLLPARSGTLRFAAAEVGARPDAHFRQRAQVVFQNSDTSLNPRQTVGVILGRAVRWFAIASIESEVAAEVGRLLDLVRLPRAYAQRYPHQLSGGEKQRVGIARALASRPRFLVCDEAVSALDVSVQASVLNLLADLRDELESPTCSSATTSVYRPHRRPRRGHVPGHHRRGGAGRRRPAPALPSLHRAAAVLRPADRQAPRRCLDASRAPGLVAGGCKFANRCARRVGSICDSVPPPLQQAGPNHAIRCHIPLPQLAAVPHWLSR